VSQPLSFLSSASTIGRVASSFGATFR